MAAAPSDKTAGWRAALNTGQADWLPPAAIFAAAAALRLWQIDLTQFEDDQAALLTGAARFIATGRIPLTSGLSFTVGVRHPPLITFLLTVPELFSRNPLAAATFTALCDALAAVFVYLAARRVKGRAAGLIAGALYSVMPAALIFGRRIWNPDFVPLFSAIGLFATIDFWQNRRSSSLAVALVALACASQLHLAAAILLLVWAAVAVSRARSIRWQPLALGLAVILAVLSPYLYLQTQSGWSDLRGVLHFLGQPKRSDLMAVDTAVTLAGSDFFQQVALPAGQEPSPFQHDLPTWALFGVAVIGAGWAVWFGFLSRGPAAGAVAEAGAPGAGDKPPRYFGRLRIGLLSRGAGARAVAEAGAPEAGDKPPRYFGRREDAWAAGGGAVIVAGWAILPVLLSLRHTTAVEPHYLLGILPALAVLQGCAISLPRPSWLPAAAAVLAIGWQLAAYVNMQSLVARSGPDTNYGMPLRFELAAAQDVLADRQGGEPIYVANADDSAGAFGYLLSSAGAIKRFDGRYTFVFPQSAAWYVSQGGQHAYQLLSEQAGSPKQVVPLADGHPAFGVFHLEAGAVQRFEAGAHLSPLAASVAHAADLLGYSAGDLAAGKPSTVELEWKVTDPRVNTGVELRQFGHLTDSSGRTWSTNDDFRGFPRPDWGPGDTVLSWFDLRLRGDTPRGGYWFDTGFYQPVSNARLTLFDGQQRAIGTSLRVGPLKVAGAAPAPPANARPLASWDNGKVQLVSASWTGENVTLGWLAQGAPSGEFTAFAHVLRPDGTLAGQHDGIPVDGTYPTSLWAPGELISDVHPVKVTASPGLRLEVGFYTQPDLRRVPVQLAGGGQAGSALILSAAADGTLSPERVG